MGIKVELTQKQTDNRDLRKLSVLPFVLELVEAGDEHVLFVDEAVFTTGQIRA